ncbi:MAG: 2-dehydropantoate 2-reductase [Saprospiraceae bacterium]|nr:2-dehydropantoate 2-reductase [Saprospiraceae bacterium]
MYQFRILVFGVGGVGGFFGGKLAAYYAQSGEVEVDFIARGEHMEAIREHGLELITDEGTSRIHPNKITDDPAQLGKYDLILLSTKTYDLEKTVRSIRGNCNPETLILPLQNGVDNSARIQDLDPGCFVLEGLVYLIAYRSAPGQITHSGSFRQLMFGSTDESLFPFLRQLEGLFQQAGIDGQFREDIRKQIWEKYFLISSLGSLSSYTQTPLAILLTNPEYRQLLDQIWLELENLAKALGVGLPENIRTITLEKTKRFKPEATSSMQRDFAEGGQTELESLCGYVVKQSQALGLQAPVMEMLYKNLQNR